eukprot:gene7389-11711_t
MSNISIQKLQLLKEKINMNYIEKEKKQKQNNSNLNQEKTLIDLINHNDVMRKVIDLSQRESDVWWTSKRNYINNPYLITIGIPTIPRIINGKTKKYLKITLESLYESLLEYKLFYPNSVHKIKVIVQLSDPKSNHEVFKKLSIDKRLKDDFYFYVPQKRDLDPHKDIPGHDYTAPTNYIPGSKARQQTFDVIHLTKTMLKKFPSDYIYYMEDDFFSCAYSIIELVRSISTLEMRRPDACSLSTSHGMNGLLIKRQDAFNFIIYAIKYSKNLAIDNLLQRMLYREPQFPLEKEIFCKPKRRSYFYRRILLEHIGSISTFKERNKKSFRKVFPKCGDVEGRYAKECWRNPENLTPCK